MHNKKVNRINNVLTTLVEKHYLYIVHGTCCRFSWMFI